jgi:type I restriction enzyme M protein
MKPLPIMAQLENIEAIEKRLWRAADTLRANSNYASNEYFMPVMGLIFLRHAYSRFLTIKATIEAGLPQRGGKVRPLSKEDYSQKSAIFLQQKAQFDYLVSLKDSDDRARSIIDAMESIESNYQSLRGVLPKNEYQELDNEVLGQLLRTLNPDELNRAAGDVFGRIYEYFLTQFADLKAHDNGEFFTPVSLVSLIANVLEPSRGVVFDPACGSGGMFVQSAHFVERHNRRPNQVLTFLGLEKNATTIRLAKMNLAVHGLEGDIQKAITYYDDPHELVGKADFVMANPPFNVDEIDAAGVKNDPRLPFGLPGVNKEGKVSNGNYVWISYFYSYLKKQGRAGFVMSAQASSAGRDEAKVRQKLIESGHVDIMIAIRSNFFYTRTVPCELWFLDKGKPKGHADKVLMIDARNIYRKLTRKIYDFSPEQLQNILATVWLYRGEHDQFLALLKGYLRRAIEEANASLKRNSKDGPPTKPLQHFIAALDSLRKGFQPFLASLPLDGNHAELLKDLQANSNAFAGDVETFRTVVQIWDKQLSQSNDSVKDLVSAVAYLAPIAEHSRGLVKQIDLLFKLVCRVIEICEAEPQIVENDEWSSRGIGKLRKALDAARDVVIDQLKLAAYFQRQAHWLAERFPDATLRDVEGYVKLVDRSEIERNDWSLTPGRYVGVAAEQEDSDFDFEEAIGDLHVEIESLNAEAVELAAHIAKTFKDLVI